MSVSHSFHRSKTVSTNHKLVNTTPKPKATKNSKGELVGPFDPPLPEVVEDIVAPEVVDVGVVRGVGVGVEFGN